jgi:hypothetical protein
MLKWFLKWRFSHRSRLPHVYLHLRGVRHSPATLRRDRDSPRSLGLDKQLDHHEEAGVLPVG